MIFWYGGAPGVRSPNGYVELTTGNPPERPPAGTPVQIRTADTHTPIVAGLYDAAGAPVTDVVTADLGYVTVGIDDVPSAEFSVDGVTWTRWVSDTALEIASLAGETAEAAAATATAAHAAAAAAVPLTSLGAPGGAASLDGAGVIPRTQVAGSIGPLDIGAAAADHSHGIGDSPDAQRALNATIAVNVASVAGEYLRRSQLTTSPTRIVQWRGQWTPPIGGDGAAAVDEWAMDPALPVLGAGTTAPAPQPEVRDANGVLLGVPQVAVTGSAVSLTADVNTLTSQTFAWLQFAVRSAADANQDTGHRNNLTVNGDYTLTGSKTGLAAGTYTARVSYTFDAVTWFDGPSTTFVVTTSTPDPGPGTGGVVLIGRSGLPWNACVFFNAGSRSDADRFANWRSRPLDGIMYFTGRASWNDLTWLRDDLTSWPGYRIVCVPPQPTGQGNNATAAGSNNAFWTSFGQLLKDRGWDDGRTIIRLGWELNGGWYDWGVGNTSRYPNAADAASLYVNAYKNVVNSVRSKAPKTLFNTNFNRDNDRAGVNWFTMILDPLVNHVDIVGVDSYDQWPAQTSQALFDQAMAQSPGPNDLHAWCVTNNKFLWFDEWGNSHWGNGNGGGDNPGYIDRMWVWMQDHAVGNGGRLAGETTYNDSGTTDDQGNLLRHSLFDPNENPNASARYILNTRWGG